MPASQRVRIVPAPLGSLRVETGAVQFGHDWPGLFIRGDEAHNLMLRVRQMANCLGDHPDAEVGNVLNLLSYYADLIDEHVIVR
jgi:hypothetical protein